MYKVQKKEHNSREENIRRGKKEYLVPRIQNREKATMVELGGSGTS